MHALPELENRTGLAECQALIERITAQVLAERIYCYPTVKNSRQVNLLFILIRNTHSQHILETTPLVNFILANSPDYAAQVAYANEVKQHLNQGNLRLRLICRDENLVYVHPESGYKLPEIGKGTKKVAKKHQRITQTEMHKIRTFRDGAEFYAQQREFAQAMFMMHQVIELGFRTAERFIIGKDKITHSIRNHQQFIKLYSEELGKLFDIDNEKDVRLLDRLDKSYKATRYGHQFKVSEKQVKRIMAKADVQRELMEGAFDALVEEYTSASVDEGNEAVMSPVDSKADSPVPSIDMPEPKPSDQEIITAKITELVDFQFLYGFGNRQGGCKSEECGETGQQRSHYYLLAITASAYGHPLELQQKLNQSLPEHLSVTWVLATVDAVNKALLAHNRFYQETIRQSDLWYCRTGQAGVWEFPQDTTLADTLDIRYRWHQRIARGRAFLQAAGYTWDNGDEAVSLSLLNQCMEQICLGLIHVFLGYKPAHSSLLYLLDLCGAFTDIAADIFLRETEEGRQQSKLLAEASQKARYQDHFRVNPNHLAVLFERCKSFADSSGDLAETHFSKIKTEG